MDVKLTVCSVQHSRECKAYCLMPGCSSVQHSRECKATLSKTELSPVQHSRECKAKFCGELFQVVLMFVLVRSVQLPSSLK